MVDALRARVVAENEIEPVVGEDRRVTKVHLNASSLSLFCNDAHCQGAPVGYFGAPPLGSQYSGTLSISTRSLVCISYCPRLIYVLKY